MREIRLTPQDNRHLANLCGHLDTHIQQIERTLHVEIHGRGYLFQIRGETALSIMACAVLKDLYKDAQSMAITPNKVHLSAQKIMALPIEELKLLEKPTMPNTETGSTQGKAIDGGTAKSNDTLLIQTRSSSIKANNANQHHYLRNINEFAVNFSVGPAGTGKTFLAVAAAVRALENEDVSRLILVRPAVEAGERLGFLPGDLAQKIDPYLRPLYDALHQLMGAEVVAKWMERGAIEVLPLAYMRGRTLNDAFIILDEAQNTTVAQMKMFLTRIGFGSTAVITGDVTQIDLPRDSQSGLLHVLKVVKKVKGIGFTFFDSKDVVRHPLVQKIIEAYADWDERKTKASENQ